MRTEPEIRREFDTEDEADKQTEYMCDEYGGGFYDGFVAAIKWVLKIEGD